MTASIEQPPLPRIARLLTDGLRIDGPYDFEVIDVKAQKDPRIYHRPLIDMGLLGERRRALSVQSLLGAPSR